MNDVINKAYEEAHRDYEKRKNEILSKLETISNSTIPPTFCKWIKQAMEFIKEKEI